MSRRVYDDLDTFYADDPRREPSPEFDYGVWWREEAHFPVWRVSWVEATGEVYAIRLGSGGVSVGHGTVAISAGEPSGRVEVLGVIPPDEDDLHRAETGVERALEGWAEQCGEPGSLAWARARVEAADTTRERPQGGEPT